MHKTDLEIANNASKKHIKDIASSLNIPDEALIVYGNDKAKINYDFLDSCNDKKDGKLILVTAISPTPAGEGRQLQVLVLLMGFAIWEKSDDLLEGTKPRTLFWHEGWSCRWWLCSGSTNDRYKLAFHRRFSCNRRCSQPFISDC